MADCAPRPIPISIGNVTLTNNEDMRGVGLSLGNPPQNFAFLPQWPLNNTYVFGSNGRCSNSWSENGCTSFRGGQYDKLGSTTRGLAEPGSFKADGPPYRLEYVTDQLIINENITLEDFPLGIPVAEWDMQGYHPQAALGLGPNSSVLHALQSTGNISSRSWSMFWGRTGATRNTQMEGTFIFGGYDRAKTSGDNYTYDLKPPTEECPTGMMVTIIDMILGFSNGTNASLFRDPKPAKFSICLIPDLPYLMTIPYVPYFMNFKSLTDVESFDRSLGINYYTMLYNEGSSTYSGDFIIKVHPGLSIRVPNDQLIVPNIEVDHHTGVVMQNASERNLVLNSLQEGNADDLPQLGRVFLSSAYLFVNQDANKFTLWAANPTMHEDLVAVDSNNAVINEFCSPAPSTTPTPHHPSSPKADNDTPQLKLPLAAIVGIVIGVVVGIGIFLCIGVRFKRAGKKKPKPQFPTSVVTEDPKPKAHSEYVPWELDGRHVVFPPPEPQELPAGSPYVGWAPVHSSRQAENKTSSQPAMF